MALVPAARSGDVERLFQSPEALLALVRAAWPHAVGAELARRTRVLSTEGAVLRVQVPDAHWRKVLHRLQGTILSRIRRLAGSATPRRIGFIEAPLESEPLEPASARVDPPGPLPAEVQAGAAAIQDPELRRLFVESATRYLARTRGR